MKKEKSNAVRPRGHALGRLVACFFCLFLGTMTLPLQAQDQNMPRVSLDVKNETLIRVIENLREQTRYNFMFNSGELRDITGITLRLENILLCQALDSLLDKVNRGLIYTIEGKTVIIRKQSQEKVKPVLVKGKVVDVKKQPIPGVTVLVKGTTIGVTTNINGEFSLSIPSPETSELMFSFVGMKTITLKCANRPKQGEWVVTMEEDVVTMEEVQVVSTGYQDIDRRKLTSAVTSLKMNDIKVAGLSTVTQMLEGHVPGMTFMQNSGQVGATPKVRIRGTSTILGNQEPLWVVDGIIQQDPVNVDPASLNDLDFVNLLGNAITGLNPDDIEQIDVLKDAAATAIYGARAANGVIVITTKKGKVGKPSVTYSLSGTVNRRPYYSDREIYMMDSRERVDVSREQFEKDMVFTNIIEWHGFEKAYLDYKAGDISYDEYKREVDYYETINTDWFDLLCKNSFTHKHTLSLSGGSNEFRYYASIGYNDENGVIRKEGKETYTAVLKLNGNFNRTSFQFGVQFNTSEADHVPNDATGKNIVQYAYETSRAIPAFNPDGTPYYYSMGAFKTGNDLNLFNMLEETRNTKNHISMSSVTLTGNVRVRLLESLTAEGTLSYSTSNTTQETVFNEKSYYIKQLGQVTSGGSNCPLGGEWRNQMTKQRSYTGRLQFNYSNYFDEAQKHFMNIALGGEISSNKYTNFSLIERGYFEDRGRTFAQFTSSMLKSEEYSNYLNWLASNSPSISDNLTNMISAYLTVTYSYDDRYVLNFNTRMDGSNQFGSRSNEKLLPIWSVSGRWNLKKDFWENSNSVNELALKFSYGKQGNMLNNQTSRMIITKGAYIGWFDGFQSTISYFPNPDLKWETTNSYNGELVFSFLQNKISGTIGYFYKKTEDAFLDKKVSEVNGISTYVINKGVVTNQGLEVSFSFTPINQAVNARGQRGFVWRLDPQLGQVVNSLVNKAINNKTNTVRDKITYTDFLNGDVELSGKPMNTFYSYRFKGLNPEDGSPEYYGLEPEREEELHAKFLNMSDEEICLEVMEESGTRVPVLQGGLSNYFGYGQFGLSLNISYSFGNKIRLLRVCDDMNVRPYPVQNVRREFLNRWRKPGDEQYTNIPALVTTNTLPMGWWENYRDDYSFADMSPYRMYDYSDIRVVRGDYVKIQAVSLRYNVHDSFCKKLGIQSAYISLSGTNLKTFASKELKGQSVEQSGSASTINLSVRPNYSLSLNVTF